MLTTLLLFLHNLVLEVFIDSAMLGQIGNKWKLKQIPDLHQLDRGGWCDKTARVGFWAAEDRAVALASCTVSAKPIVFPSGELKVTTMPKITTPKLIIFFQQ